MENSFLILTAVLAVTWLAGAILVWWNLRRQERLVGNLYQLTACLLEPPRLGDADADADDHRGGGQGGLAPPLPPKTPGAHETSAPRSTRSSRRPG